MSSDTTLVLERRPGGLRLYLGGDLQFDTADEAIYHERLAHPALLAARARFEGPLNLLVLGGGDGLLVRELLRHEGVASVRLIDFNPQVLALAGTELAPWNGSSLADNRVVVLVADVRKALAKAGSFHAIFSDLTAPGTLDDCGLFTLSGSTRLQRRAPGARGHPRLERALSGPDPGGVLVHLPDPPLGRTRRAPEPVARPQLRRVGIWRLGVLPRLGPSHHTR